MRATTRALAMTLIWSGVAGGCLAQKAPSWGENKLLALMPELRKLPSPSWVKEGARVSYYSASASVSADRFYYYKNEHGNWSRGDEVGPAGAGITQYTVVARSETSVVGNLESYLQTSGVMAPSYSGGTVDPAGAGACWANPAALVKATRFQSGSLLVMKAPYPLNGKTFSSLRCHSVSDRAVRDEVYDLASGILLFYGSAVLSGDGRHTQLAQMTLISRRQISLPATNPTRPDWVAQTNRLEYQGTVSLALQGSPQFPIPTSLSLQKTAGGARWAEYEVTRQTQGQLPGSGDLICGAGQLMGEPWTSPALLQNLRRGQILDQDPVTHATVEVADVTQGPAGVMVVLSESGAGYKRLRGYDRATGKELMLTALQQVGPGVQQTQLQLAQ